MTKFRSLAVASLLACLAWASDDEWLSPEYKEFYQHPLPFPPDKVPKYTYKNQTTGAEIDYYEVDVHTFEQQVYTGLKPATLVGYDGISPGPTFRMTRGREAVVRFVNHGVRDISIHLHGSYSMP